jgi:G3E family GTPase
MRLHTLLPRPLDPTTSPESPSILTALLSGIHLDRRQARALGWRGVRPSALYGPAWTCRVAPLAHVFGLVFLDEHVDNDALRGTFAASVFPAAQSDLLDSFPLRALEIALGPDYADAVRELSAHAEALAPFCLGHLDLAAALDGSWLSLRLSAPARLRVVSAAGIPIPPEADGGGSGAQAVPQWLVPPGGLECDVPAFRLLLRLFAALAGTAAHLLDVEPDVRLHRTALAAQEGPQAPEPGWRMHLAAVFGGAPHSAAAPGKKLSRLPGRYAPRPDELSCLPVMHVLTGFLGSGKTTFLRRWLDFLNGRERYAAVIQNEFGQIGLDAALTRSETRVEALDEGCVCCSLADTLRPGLQRLLAAAPAEQVILETTGLANPANILRSLGDLAEFVQPGLVVTVVDALEWRRGGYAARGVSGVRLAQVEQADVIIANKADAVAESDFGDILRALRACNAKACILPAVQGNIAFARLDAFLADWQDARMRPPSRQPRLHTLAQAQDGLGTHVEEGFSSHTIPMQTPVDENSLRQMLDAAGPGLCRAKGIVNLLHDGRVVPAVVQYAAGQLEFEAAPEDENSRYLVFIGIDLAPREALADALAGADPSGPAA